MSSFGPVTALTNLGSTLQNTFAAGNRVLDILEEEPMVKEINGQKEVAFHGAKAEHVTFSYGQETILKDVSADIKKTVSWDHREKAAAAIYALKLLMRFWDVQEGSVSISGTGVNQINTSNLRDMEEVCDTGNMPVSLDSVAANLRIAKLDATHGRTGSEAPAKGFDP